MSYKMPAETCVLFKAASPAFDTFTVLDIRLGLEQIQDTPGYRDAAMARWALEEPTAVDPGPEEALLNFTHVTSKHETLTEVDVLAGLAAIVDTTYYVNSCQQRWAAWDANPWPLVGEEVDVDLAGFSDAA